MTQPLIEEIYGTDEVFFEEEDIRRYKPGGYHPVRLDDLYHERYRIRHKLGHGGLSTVWLARDEQKNRWVAMKIKTSESSKSVVLPKLDEIAALRRLRQSPEWGGNPGSQRIVTILDHFVMQGPNGRHHCLVFELLGPSIAAVLASAHVQDEEYNTCFTANQIFSVSAQLLQAVKFIHTAGISQGDISISNIAFAWDEMSQMSEENLFKIVGEPYGVKVKRQDGAKLDTGVPQEIISAINWWSFPKSKMAKIKVIDFGEAFEGSIESHKLAQPPHLRSPEGTLLGRVGLEADLWRVGSAICHICMGYDYLGWGSDVYQIDSMIQLLEKVPPNIPGNVPQDWPQAWCAAWNRMQVDAASKGEYQPIPRGPEPFLKGKFEGRFDDQPSLHRIRDLWPVIAGLLRILPERRISASQALSMVMEAAEISSLN